ncbi:MAG: hypothetical protein RL213_2288 [Bacteroidota bacterium]
MVLAVSIVDGFKKEIRDKLTGFNGHIQVSRFDRNFSYESTPFSMNASEERFLKGLPEVRHVQHFATKAGILKKGSALLGVVAKGVDTSYDWTFFRKNLLQGRVLNAAAVNPLNEAVISESMAVKLNVSVGDSLVMYFIQDPPRARKIHIAGIYATGFEEFDKLYLLCDIGLIRKLNGWEQEETGGIEIQLQETDGLEETTQKIYAGLASDLNARSIREMYPQIFDWLELQDVNAAIIIALMVIVSGINMISALLVVLLERIGMIGTMKAIGSSDGQLRRIFLWVSFYIVGRGVLLGNAIGIGLVLLQQQLHLVPLERASYYIDYVPVLLDPLKLLLLTGGTLAACVSLLVLPTLMIRKVQPVSALRFS